MNDRPYVTHFLVNVVSYGDPAKHGASAEKALEQAVQLAFSATSSVQLDRVHSLEGEPLSCEPHVVCSAEAPEDR